MGERGVGRASWKFWPSSSHSSLSIASTKDEVKERQLLLHYRLGAWETGLGWFDEKWLWGEFGSGGE
jgi:hypothetical protein